LLRKLMQRFGALDHQSLWSADFVFDRAADY